MVQDIEVMGDSGFTVNIKTEENQTDTTRKKKIRMTTRKQIMIRKTINIQMKPKKCIFK